MYAHHVATVTTRPKPTTETTDLMQDSSGVEASGEKSN